MRCETSTPFGRPVVPDVYMTAKVSSAAGAGSFQDGAARRRASATATTSPVAKICAAVRFAPLAAIVAVSVGIGDDSFGAE